VRAVLANEGHGAARIAAVDHEISRAGAAPWRIMGMDTKVQCTRLAVALIVRAMRIRYGHITGWCTRCGCEDFERASPAGEPKTRTQLRCVACGATARQSDVVCLIGDQAVKEMRASLHALQERYRPHRARRR